MRNDFGEQSVSSILIEAPVNPMTCAHATIEEVGHDGDATFYHCPVCGSVVISQHGRRWIIRLTDERGPFPY